MRAAEAVRLLRHGRPLARGLVDVDGVEAGTHLELGESAEGLVLSPVRQTRSSRRQAGWRALRGAAKGTTALKEHLAEHRREATR